MRMFEPVGIGKIQRILTENGLNGRRLKDKLPMQLECNLGQARGE